MGRRGVNDSPKPYLEPVEKIEVSEKHFGRRAIAAAVFLLIGVGAFAYFIVGLVRGEPGWTEITALSSRVNCSGDFVFLYEVGADSGSAQSERRDVTAAYTAAAEKAYWMFENVRAAGDFADEDDESGGETAADGATGGQQSEAGVTGAGRTLADGSTAAVNSIGKTSVDGKAAAVDSIGKTTVDGKAMAVGDTGQAEAYGSSAARAADEIHGCAVAETASGKTAIPAVGSVRFLNDHPNEEVTIDAPLYEAFAKLDAAGGRWLYLPAVYQMYNNLFDSEADPIAAEFDPRENEEVAAYFEEFLVYANDPDAVDLELLGDNRVRLSVSEEYLDFAAENGIDSFIDFYWMKNAFIADYLAESLADVGFTHGSISSYDGFVRNLDERDVSYSFNIYDRVVTGAESSGADGQVMAENAANGSGSGDASSDVQNSETEPPQSITPRSNEAESTRAVVRNNETQQIAVTKAPVGQICQIAVMQYYGPVSMVYLHDYAITSLDQQRYYQMTDGEMRTPYIDPLDGLCRNSISSLVSYSYDDSVGCADILLSIIPMYIADEFDASAVEALAGKSGTENGSAASAGIDDSFAKAAGDGSSSEATAAAVYSIYRLGDEIRANDPAAEFTAVYEGYTIN